MSSNNSEKDLTAKANKKLLDAIEKEIAEGADVVAVAAFRLSDDNPRDFTDADVEDAIASMRAFPEMLAKRKIVVRRGVAIGGNVRLCGLQRIGITSAPSTWFESADEWTPKQAREFMIKDNAHFGKWNEDMLFTDWQGEIGDDWGDVPVFDTDIADVEETADEDVDMRANFVIKCADMKELARLQKLLKTKAQKMPFNAFIEVFNDKEGAERALKNSTGRRKKK